MRVGPFGIRVLIQTFRARRTARNATKRQPNIRNGDCCGGGVPRPSGDGWTRQPSGWRWSGGALPGGGGGSLRLESALAEGSSAIRAQSTPAPLAANERFRRLLSLRWGPMSYNPEYETRSLPPAIRSRRRIAVGALALAMIVVLGFVIGHSVGSSSKSSDSTKAVKPAAPNVTAT